MFYLGLDVHGKWSTIKGFDPHTGEVLELTRVPNEPEPMHAALGALEGPLHGVMEAGTNSWAMYRQLRPLFAGLTMAHPADLWDRRTERGAKTDKRDAMRMAEMLYRGEVKGIYIPPEGIQDLRVLVRGKVRASRWVTRLTNEIGSLLRSWGYVGARSLLTKKGAGDLDQAQLPARSARVLALWRQLLETAQAIEDELQAAIEKEAAHDPDCALLETMPAVGPFTALLVKAEVGDIHRFADAEALISYAGLAPRVYQSGERCHYGRLGPWGNRWLRYALVLLANRIARSHKDNRLHRVYVRTCLRQKSNSAKIAVARKATQLMHYLLKHKQTWQEPTEKQRAAVAA
jgi:transposase